MKWIAIFVVTASSLGLGCSNGELVAACDYRAASGTCDEVYGSGQTTDEDGNDAAARAATCAQAGGESTDV